MSKRGANEQVIRIASRRAKRILAAHLAETCPEHRAFLVAMAKQFGMDMEIQLPEDSKLRAKLERAK